MCQVLFIMMKKPSGKAIRRERAVELMFEDHRWWDIRRWMVAHELFSEQYPIKGIQATPKNANHANVRIRVHWNLLLK